MIKTDSLPTVKIVQTVWYTLLNKNKANAIEKPCNR
jgi:hypothetical protein